MNVAIMTTALSPNYGAALQTYALSRAILDLNIDVDVYSYNDKRRLTDGMNLLSKVKYYLWNTSKIFLFGGKKEKAFKVFRNENIPMTEKTYRCNQELCDDPGEYDVYIAGSDQIWNPDFFRYDMSYFLNFVPEGKKKISYASSFAKRVFSSPYYDECSKLLSDFDAISVREHSGINIVKELCGKEAVQVLDPTLLLNRNEWAMITENSSLRAKQFSGILCYIMPGDKAVTNAIEKNAQMIHKLTGLPIMRLGIKEYNWKKYKAEEVDLFASPTDFVTYFLNAQYVVTNSFHGTAFGINFGKQTIIPYNSQLKKEKAIHERIFSLLEELESFELLIPNEQIINELPIQNVDKTSKLLQKEREKSILFLKSALIG